VLVGITGVYVALTWWLVTISHGQAKRAANPVVYARPGTATVLARDDGTHLDVDIRLSILGQSPAIGIWTTTTLQLWDGSGFDKGTQNEFGLSVLAPGELRKVTVTHPAPQLGRAGRDDRTVAIFFTVATEYLDTTNTRYASLYMAPAAHVIRTPENVAHSRGVALQDGPFTSQARTRNPVRLWKLARVRKRALRHVDGDTQ
jgi:hypothetical protein